MKNRLLRLGWYKDEKGNWVEPKEDNDTPKEKVPLQSK